ncbi:hypothetical protein AMTRI_Chr01g111210 [Amborella trichopoda]|uniref:RING-type E3 ubiquitin transferase n=1 Tax=Amborella trichopoda TaxID=13333 RepID=W1PVF5_AMBTC|nr:probable E3 ubiquitin-protein ligase HIP1 [Amborella trichopoda]XP_011626283.1 probable E3 ubiquitin-protein ligase HIP1 [Amborella trichopoda]XP_020527781.1 probable E3 ubiquitin-protein ligase HIP1 [Amborella trichopoda]XP_020527782.1 probable E3 ubiquitin-protein ligase HIP1 [Amborella trichopoda]XP_020527783.1 probable E3 ubiquitin-protein ligase HIP1 [Amborella trichopoda]XP_020527784.1 probable E3 ubiquitin-protein ligase HIP1 [Amborella trichopoda]XP_020527785.1 probable E3 ubiquiti|eukprot:XP_006852545.1 probable E3 ubiquitin-protein ligase HIP1 [Amborella trichopoda]
MQHPMNAGQRNVLCSAQMFDVEMEPGQSNLRPEPCIFLGALMDIPSSSNHPGISAPGNIDLSNPQRHPSSYFNQNEYHHPITPPNLGIAPSELPYNPYIIHSAAGPFCPIPPNHALNHRNTTGIGAEEFNRADNFMDNGRGSCKRKSVEGMGGDYSYPGPMGSFVCEGSSSNSGMHHGASSSSSGTVNGMRQWEEALGSRTGMSLDYRGSAALSIVEGSERSVRSRSTGINLYPETALTSDRFQGSYGHSVSSGSDPWVEPLRSGDGTGSSWSNLPVLPGLHRRIWGSVSSESRNLNQEPNWFVAGRSIPSAGPTEMAGGEAMPIGNFCHSPPLNPHLHHHQPPPLQAMRGGHNSFFAPANTHTMNPNNHHIQFHPHLSNSYRDGWRYTRSFTERLARPLATLSFQRPLQLPHADGRARMISEDVMMVDRSAFYGGLGSLNDQHRDMRLDIDDMSYEELLALEERIGDVNTGLSEESISKCLKMRIFNSFTQVFTAHKPETVAQEYETCIICQEEYREKDEVGTLECGHDYHADCIKHWLMLKNVCPICKSHAMDGDAPAKDKLVV